MDILNWLRIKKENLIRPTLDSPKDLIVLGADVSFQKRGDKYQSYAMPAEDFGLAIGISPKFIDTTDGITVATPSPTTTKSKSVLIPANTVKVGDTVFIRTRCRKTGTANISIQTIHMNTADTISGAYSIANNALANTSLYSQMSRTLAIKSATITEALNITGAGGVDDDVLSINTAYNFNIDWTRDQYMIFALANINSADQSVVSYYEITVNKKIN